MICRAFVVPRAWAVVAVASAVLALVVPPAQAFTTYTPSGGPGVQFVNQGTIVLTDRATGDAFSCPTFIMTGTVTNPGVSRGYAPATGNTGPMGASLGSIDTSSGGGCINGFFGPTAITAIGTWAFAITGDKVGSDYPAKLYNMKAYVNAANCKFYIGGAADTATSAGTGWLTGRFNPTTQVFRADLGSSGLFISTPPSGSVCTVLGLLEDDEIEVGGPTSGSSALWKNVAVPGLAVANP